MCFSLAGRLQTRLIALVAPLLITTVLIAFTGDQRYFTMFIVMAVIAIDLDLFLYTQLFRYQPRWADYVLGLFEFLVTFAVVRWLGGTLPVPAIEAYYLASWIGSQVLIHVVLPLIDPLWVEHGGEIWRPTSRVRARGTVTRAWAYVRGGPREMILALAACFYVVLALTVLPSSLTMADVLAAVAAPCALALVLHRAGAARAPRLDEALATGLILAALLRGADPWVYAAAGVIGVGIRIWLRIDGRMALNGIAGAYLLTLLLAPGAYSADGEWGNSLLLPLVTFNVAFLLALRSGRVPLLISFLALVVGAGLTHGAANHNAFQVTVPGLLPVPLLLFCAFMLLDPETGPPALPLQVLTGVAVTVLGLALDDGALRFVLALLAVNYATCLIAVVPRLWGRAVAGPPAAGGAGEGTVSRRTFLRTGVAVAGAALLGGSLHRLEQLDPAALSLPAEPALAGGSAVPRFQDVAAQAGIVLQHHGNRSEGSPDVGTGVAWADYDHDGRIDVYVTDHAGASHLYRNNGNGTFTDVAQEAGVAHPGRATSATFVDYDNDGWPDLYVGVAYGPNRLYHNNQDGTFTDVTKQAGLGDTGRTMSTAWGDYDGDGYLDVFVANYPDSAITFDANSTPEMNTREVSHIYPPTNRLFHNNGDGTFTDVTHQLGDGYQGFGFSAVWFDYDRDGRPDLYVAYDFGAIRQPSTLWRNSGPSADGWRWTEMQNRLGVNTEQNPMGVASGDYNNDGWLDLAESGIGRAFLYRSARATVFREVAQQARISHATNNLNNMLDPSMTWGVSFADFNNDGWLDLYLAAGAIYDQNVPQPNQMYLNDHHGGFVDVSDASGANDGGQGRSVAVADFDDDGYLDMFVANYGQAPLLYRNLSRGLGNRWLRFDLEGTQSNRDAVGARVTVYAKGLRPQMREVQIGQGLGSCNERTLHFGLAGADRAERVEIRWPSGRHQVLKAVDSNQTLHIVEPGRSRWK